MSHSDSIKNTLNIKDKNITISEISEGEENKHGRKVLVAHGTLSYSPLACPNCHLPARMEEKQMIVKNGSKNTTIRLMQTPFSYTILKLKKQRFFCRHCCTYHTAKTSLVDRFCSISNLVRYQLIEELKERQSGVTIAKRCGVSWSTVQRILASLKEMTITQKQWLPECLLVDEFRSLKNIEGKFSFSCMDGTTGKLFDILPDRRKSHLTSHFLQFDLAARQKVKYLVTDMNAPYFSLVKECFPNAQVIVDRFHIVQHINRAFEKVRRRVMNQLNQNDPFQAKQYRQLKSLFKLLLKHQDKLDFTEQKKWRNFRGSQLFETEVVDRLLSISDELKVTYHYYQDLLSAFNDKLDDEFFTLLTEMPNEVPKELHHLKKAFFKYEDGIRLALKEPYSNGRLENLHTHIKVLKRIAYGFRSFANMRTRIFLLNGLVEFN